MNTETIVHPTLQHFGLTTANLEAMIDWYRKVLGMTINHRSAAPAGAQKGPSLSAVWLSNDEVNHRIAFVELPGVPVGNLRSEILVMQSAQNWDRQRATDSLHGTWDRCVLVQR